MRALMQDWSLTLDKLLAGRYPVALVPDLAVQSRPDTDKARLERLEPDALQLWYQAVFSKKFAAGHSQFMRSYWRALCQASRKQQPELPRCPA